MPRAEGLGAAWVPEGRANPTRYVWRPRGWLTVTVQTTGPGLVGCEPGWFWHAEPSVSFDTTTYATAAEAQRAAEAAVNAEVGTATPAPADAGGEARVWSGVKAGVLHGIDLGLRFASRAVEESSIERRHAVAEAYACQYTRARPALTPPAGECGAAYSQWTCNMPAGHTGCHEDRAPGGGCVGWAPEPTAGEVEDLAALTPLANLIRRCAHGALKARGVEDAERLAGSIAIRVGMTGGLLDAARETLEDILAACRDLETAKEKDCREHEFEQFVRCVACDEIAAAEDRRDRAIRDLAAQAPTPHHEEERCD